LIDTLPTYTGARLARTHDNYSGSSINNNIINNKQVMIIGTEINIGVDFGGSPGTCTPIIRIAHAFITFNHLLPPNILLCPPNILNKSTSVEIKIPKV